ncbi:putative F0F1-ATPase subunit [compost metagenome]
MNNNQDNKNSSKWIALVNIPFQMGVIIGAGVYFGSWLDSKYSSPDSSTFIIIFSLLAVFIALYNVIRQVKNLGDKP